MRKLRVNIFDDDASILKLLKRIMSMRDYEVLTFERAAVCPIYGTRPTRCDTLNPCADIIITDYQMPQMSGLEMLFHQAQRGCKVDIRNKLVMSSDLDNKGQKMLEESGYTFFRKPFKNNKLLAWLDGCEKRIDLSKPLGIMRKEDRYPVNIDIEYTYNSTEKIYKATVINYSSSGLCLEADTPFAKGQFIVIKTELPNDCKNVSVRWAKEMGPVSTQIGCSCR